MVQLRVQSTSNCSSSLSLTVLRSREERREEHAWKWNLEILERHCALRLCVCIGAVSAKGRFRIAPKIKKAPYQQPCYCHCDRGQGHTSLLDCFASKHGSGCGTCIYEDFYTFEQSSKGKSAAQIRAGIIKGEWKSVDATKYQKLLPAK